DLDGRKDAIKRVVDVEEARFHETLDQGMEILEALMEELEQKGETVLAGDAAFRLYDTYGFPLELTQEILSSRGFSLDHEGFDEAMEAQRKRARAARAQMGYLGDVEGGYADLDIGIAFTPFVG